MSMYFSFVLFAIQNLYIYRYIDFDELTNNKLIPDLTLTFGGFSLKTARHKLICVVKNNPFEAQMTNKEVIEND